MKKKPAKGEKPPFEWKTGDDDPLPEWPAGKPFPGFKSYEEEVKFWHSYNFKDPPESEWEELEYVPRATHKPRPHVYRVRFSDEEMAVLQTLAKRRGVSASVILRDFVRSQVPQKRARKTA